MATEKKSNEPLSFSFTEAEIGNACRAAIVNRLRDGELAKAPFRAEVIAHPSVEVGVTPISATVTFWPKRVRKSRAKGAQE